jgi:hypothetical protein
VRTRGRLDTVAVGRAGSPESWTTTSSPQLFQFARRRATNRPADTSAAVTSAGSVPWAQRAVARDAADGDELRGPEHERHDQPEEQPAAQSAHEPCDGSHPDVEGGEEADEHQTHEHPEGDRQGDEDRSVELQHPHDR